VDVFAHVHVLWLEKDAEALFLADDQSQDSEENRSSRTSSPLSRTSLPSTRPSTREVRVHNNMNYLFIFKGLHGLRHNFLGVERESVGRGCADRGHAPQSHVRTHTPTSINNVSRTGPATHVATLIKTRFFAPPQRRLGSQHHEALLLSSRGSGAGMTGATSDHVAPSQVLYSVFGALLHTQLVAS